MGGEREREKKNNLYETSIAIKSQNSCHGNPALPCSFRHRFAFTTDERCIAPKKQQQRSYASPVLRTGGYVTSMATVFSDRLFSAGLSCS